MDRLILSLKKRIFIPVVCLVGIVVWLYLCKAHYESYWNGTIFRVQTVDFNMLHHMLPTTLSTLISAGRDDLVQDVLDSNFGIFGLVVTDSKGNSILYRTSKVYHKASWHKLISPEFLSRSAEPYDLLTDPVPLAALYAHDSPRSGLATAIAKQTAARVLGRVYYVRQPPPPFSDDLLNFASTSWLELSGAKRGYLLLTLVTIGFSLALIFSILFRKRSLEAKQQELEHIEKELAIRKKALDHLTCELMAGKTRKEWLEKEADQTYRRALVLKESLARLKEAFSEQGSASGKAAVEAIKIRPPVHPPSALLEEIESLVPDLTADAQSLRQQALQLQEYCQQLERNQAEMKRILDQAYERAMSLPGNLLPFRGKY